MVRPAMPFSRMNAGLQARCCQGHAGEGLLADAEAGEDPPQQVVAAEGAGDLAQCLLRHAQVFGQQLAGAHQGELVAAVLEVLLGLMQRFNMAAAGAEAAFCGLLITHAGFQVLAQQLEAFGGLGRQAEGDMAIGTGF